MPNNLEDAPESDATIGGLVVKQTACFAPNSTCVPLRIYPMAILLLFLILFSCCLYIIQPCVFPLSLQICGGFFFGIGIWMHVDEDMVVYVHIIRDTASGPFFDNIPYILIGIGSFVALLSFLGCCGACSESVCFLCMVRMHVTYCLGRLRGCCMHV